MHRIIDIGTYAAVEVLTCQNDLLATLTGPEGRHQDIVGGVQPLIQSPRGVHGRDPKRLRGDVRVCCALTDGLDRLHAIISSWALRQG